MVVETKCEKDAKFSNISINNNVSSGDNITLNSDAAKISFGADSDVILTHVHNTGLLLNSNKQIQFNDSQEAIFSNGTALVLKSGNIEFTLPTADGTEGYQLTTDGGGVLSWKASGSGGSGISFDGSTANGVCTFKDSDEATVEPNFTYDGTDILITSSTPSKPILTIKNTTNDANGSRLQFVKDKGAAGADGDDIGIIEFIGDDAAETQTTFAKIVAEVSEADNTDEAGKLSFFVAESDGTTTALTAGLILEGEHATDGQVDVTIAAGAGSTTTIAGDIKITTDIILDDGGSLKEAGGTAAITFDGSGNITKLGQSTHTNGLYLKLDSGNAVWADLNSHQSYYNIYSDGSPLGATAATTARSCVGFNTIRIYGTSTNNNNMMIQYSLTSADPDFVDVKELIVINNTFNTVITTLPKFIRIKNTGNSNVCKFFLELNN